MKGLKACWWRGEWLAGGQRGAVATFRTLPRPSRRRGHAMCAVARSDRSGGFRCLTRTRLVVGADAACRAAAAAAGARVCIAGRRATCVLQWQGAASFAGPRRHQPRWPQQWHLQSLTRFPRSACSLRSRGPRTAPLAPLLQLRLPPPSPPFGPHFPAGRPLRAHCTSRQRGVPQGPLAARTRARPRWLPPSLPSPARV